LRLLLLMRRLRGFGPLLPASTASPSFPSVFRQTNLPFLALRRRNRFTAKGGAITTIKLVHFLQVPLLARVRFRGEPTVQYLPCDDLGRAAKAQAEDVRLVPGSRPARCLSVSAEGSANARDFIRRDRHARTSPAEQNTLVRLAVSDAPGNCLSDVRPRGRAAVGCTEQQDIVAATPQLVLNEFRQMRPFVAAESNTQNKYRRDCRGITTFIIGYPH